jgi:phosphoglycolate phosphatase
LNLKISLFFDLDGTLCDPREGIVRCLRYALYRLGYPCPQDEQLERLIGPPLYRSFGTLLNSTDAELVDHAVALYRDRFVSAGMFENSVYTGIERALAALRTDKTQLYVVTSKPTVFAIRILEHFGMRKFFDGIHGSELDGTLSDNRQLIAHVLAEEGMLASNAVMVGDREHDIRGALANEVLPIGVLWGYGTRQELTEEGASVLCENPESLTRSLSLGSYQRR